MPTLDLHGAINKYAVYNGASDAPLTDPMNNLGNLLWHSDLPYIGAQQTVIGTLNLDPTTSGWVGTNYSGTISYPYTYTLATHGLAFTPYFLGYIEVSGVKLPLNGSFVYGYNIYNVHSDETGIKIVVDYGALLSFAYNVVCPFSLRILNAGTDAGGGTVFPALYNGFEATTDRLRCGYFDTNNRYVIKDVAGDIRFHTGNTIDVQILQPKYRSATCRATCIIFKSDAYIASALGANSQSTAFAVPAYALTIK